MSGGRIEIKREDPRAPDVARLVRDLDGMFNRLYPAESNHLIDIETLAAPDIHFFVARRDGEALGCGALWHRDPAYGEIKRVYVRPEARGLKLSKLILAALEQNARAHGYKTIKLETGTLQPEAMGLFVKYGFTRCGPYADYPVDDPFSVFMEKTVA
ncbi:MAG: GNAT family N-acetyltransferase [Parvibaculaceae bacterium]